MGRPSSQEDMGMALGLDPLKKSKKSSKKSKDKSSGNKSKDKGSKKSKGKDKGGIDLDISNPLDISNHFNVSNHNLGGGDLKSQLKLVKKLNCLGEGPYGGSSDGSVSDRTEKTFPMDESFSSDADSLTPKSVEGKATKKGKKKKEKKSKAEGIPRTRKKRRGRNRNRRRTEKRRSVRNPRGPSPMTWRRMPEKR